MIEFHDPRGRTAVPQEPYRLRVDLQSSNDPRIAFLANGFPDSENFLQQLAEVMAEQLPSMHAEHFNKGDASIAAPDPMLAQIESGCVAAVAAYGH